MHRIAEIFTLILLTLVVACGKKTPEPSLPDEKISRIMADLYLADAATTGLAGYSKDSLMHVYFDQVLAIHGVTKQEYEENLRILAQDLPRMETVVRAASDMLNTDKKEDDKKE